MQIYLKNVIYYVYMHYVCSDFEPFSLKLKALYIKP
jgi:hypothetical protein